MKRAEKFDRAIRNPLGLMVLLRNRRNLGLKVKKAPHAARITNVSIPLLFQLHQVIVVFPVGAAILLLAHGVMLETVLGAQG